MSSKLSIVVHVPRTARSDLSRARAYLERLSRPDLFPNPAIEEDEFSVSYFTLEERARRIAQRMTNHPAMMSSTNPAHVQS